jgi:c-di-GMP phosphodiesterase
VLKKSDSTQIWKKAPAASSTHLNVMGLDAVCDGRRAFINCSHDMLLKGFFQLLPAEKAVVEIQENVPVDERVVAACKQLRMESYEIALDNVTPGDAREKLIPFANYLKIDIRRVVEQRRATLVAKHGANCIMIAHKVETRLQFLAALKDGFTLFQGYFFRHPERMRSPPHPREPSQPAAAAEGHLGAGSGI